MTIREININELKEYDNNPRVNDAAVKAVAASIKEFGFKVPIIIDSDNVIVAGHTRLKAAKKLKMDVVPCIVADDLKPEQIKAFRLADNKVSELAEWDFDKLETELAELEQLDFNMTPFGFEDSSIVLDDIEGDGEEKYTSKINIPKYEPTGECPELSELADTTKTNELLEEIKQADIPKDIKDFLKIAAQRHTVFDYSKIAEFYAHADEQVQDLMERSALVIIDIDKAIEYGYVKMSSELDKFMNGGEEDDA